MALIPATVSLAISGPDTRAENSGSTIVFRFTRTGPTTAPVTENFSVAGTAKSVADGDFTENAATFTDAAGTVVIPMGSATADVTVTPTGDNKVELNETVILTVVAGAGYDPATGGAETDTGNINNDDQAVISFFAVPTGLERHTGTNPGFDFDIRISNPVDVAVTIDVDTVNGEATAGSDFTAVNATETFPADTAGAAGEQTRTVTVTGDHTDERAADADPNDEEFFLRLSNIAAMGRNVIFLGAGPNLDGQGTIQNDDYDTQIVISDSADPTEHSETFNVVLSVRVVTVAGAFNPPVPPFASALTVNDSVDGAFDVAKASPGGPGNVTFTDFLEDALRNSTLTGAFAANIEPGPSGRRFNASANTEMHVVNNEPEFTLTSDPLVINGVTTTISGPSAAVQSSPAAPEMFMIPNFALNINSDRFDGGGNDNTEEGQTVSFNVTLTAVNGGAVTPLNNPFLPGPGQPAISDSAGAGFANGTLTFTTRNGVAAIVDLSVTAVDDGEDFAGNGAQTSPAQTFTLAIYSVQPFDGDLAIADRGNRVFDGSVLLIHTNSVGSPMKFPTQNLVSDQLVDGYDISVHTNLLSGHEVLEYLVVDYETVSSNKGRGEQGLFGVHSVSLQRRLISSGGNFSFPIAVDVLPGEAGGNAGMIAVGDSGSSASDPGKVILVHPKTGAQTLLTSGDELYWLTGMTVAPEGSPLAGQIFATDIGNVLGQTARKNDKERKIVQIDPVTGNQTLLISETNDFRFVAPPITNLWYPVGIDVDPTSGSLVIADAYSKTIWKLECSMGVFATELEALSIDTDFLQPTHLAIQGDLASGFIFMTDGETIAPGFPYPANTRRLHRITPSGDPETNSEIFTDNGVFQEPRGIEIIPIDPLTGM